MNLEGYGDDNCGKVCRIDLSHPVFASIINTIGYASNPSHMVAVIRVTEGCLRLAASIFGSGIHLLIGCLGMTITPDSDLTTSGHLQDRDDLLDSLRQGVFSWESTTRALKIF